MIYEIVNPSDAYTLEADDREAACLAVLILGQGKYGLATRSGEGEMPPFILGGAEDWYTAEFGRSTKAGYEAIGRERLAAVLDTVLIGHQGDREMFADAVRLMDDPAKREEFRRLWHDRKRTSLNDIGRRASAVAVALRKEAAGANG